MTGLIVSGAVAVLALLFLLFILQSARLGKAKDDLAAQQATNSSLQSQIADLQKFRDLKDQLAARQTVLTEATQGEVLWSGVLRDVSMVIPGNMWLTTMSGQLAAPGTTSTVAGPTSGPQLIGNIQFTGTTMDQPTLSKWLSRLDDVDGWVNPWVSADTKTEQGVIVYTFSGTVDLTSEATVDGRPR